MLAAGCRAQSTAVDSQLSRRIEILVRSQFPVPAGYTITIGARAKSEFTGFDTIPVTFQRGEKKSSVNFLLSTDNKTLARLEKFDLSKDPAESVSYANRPVRGNPAAKVVISTSTISSARIAPRCTRSYSRRRSIATKIWFAWCTRTTRWWRSTPGPCMRP